MFLVMAVCGLVPCCPDGYGLAQPPACLYRWERLGESEWCLWRGAAQVGNYKDGAYRVRTAPGQWAEDASPAPCPLPAEAAAAARKKCGCSKGCDCKKGKCGCDAKKRCNPKCPCPIQDGATVEGDGSLNFGLDKQKIQESEEGPHVLNGKTVSREELLEAIGKPQLPNDAGWLCLTAIGSAAETAPVLADFASSPALATWRDKIKLKAFEPGHWAMQPGFVTTGHPGIYLEAPDGKVLYRWDDYPGAEALAEVLRVKDPNYDPSRDPGPNRPAPADGADGVFGLVAVAAGGLGCFGIFGLGVVLAAVLAFRALRKRG